MRQNFWLWQYLTLVLLGPNTQPYTDNYDFNHYHPTPTTILYTSPPTYLSAKKSYLMNHLKPSPIFPHKNTLLPPSIPPPPKENKKKKEWKLRL